MQADLKALQSQVEQLTESQQEARDAYEIKLAGIESQLAATEKRQQDAIDRLRTGSADSGLELETIKQELDQLKGKIAELKSGVSGTTSGDPIETAAASGAIAAASKTVLPTDAADLYRYGYERKQAKDCSEAVRAFAEYTSKFPKKERADSAFYLMAECQYEAKDYTGSVRSLQTILQKYQKGNKVDDALLLMHDNFVALGRCKDAQPFLETLIADYPRSKLVKSAKSKLKDTKKNCK